MKTAEDVMDFYFRHIYDEEKINLLLRYNLKIAGYVSPVIWELFGALLTGSRGTGNVGADLSGWEVKSAKNLASFEYQYHLENGISKLDEDASVNHLFFSYSSDYKNIYARITKGIEIKTKFIDAWKPAYLKNYDTSKPINERRQRFRRSIPFGWVESKTKLIFHIKGKEMFFFDEITMGNLEDF